MITPIAIMKYMLFVIVKNLLTKLVKLILR